MLEKKVSAIYREVRRLVRFNVDLNLFAVECVHLQHELVKGNLSPGTPFCLNELQVLSTPHGSQNLTLKSLKY